MTEQLLKDIVESISDIKNKSDWESKARKRWTEILNLSGHFGAIEEQIIRLCGLKKTLNPHIDQRWLVVMAGDHGIAHEGISTVHPSETTRLVKSMLNGKAISCILANYTKCDILLVDMGLSQDLSDSPKLIIKKVCEGTSNSLVGPAMTRENAITSILAGFDTATIVADKGADLLVIGELGIGNTTAASAIVSVMIDCSVEEATGYGSGIDESTRQRKIIKIKEILKTNAPSSEDPIGVLQTVGGFEIGGIVGLMLGSAKHQIPFLMDGFVVMAALQLACRLCPNVRDWAFFGNHIPDDSNKIAANSLKLKPTLQFPIRLGQGIGALLSIPLIEGTLKVFSDIDSSASKALSA